MDMNAIKNFREMNPDVVAVVLLGKDGSPLSFSVPEGVHIETFSIMCATMMGAAGTGTQEIEGDAPRTMVVKGGSSTIIVYSVDSKRLFACASNTDVDAEALLHSIERAFSEL